VNIGNKVQRLETLVRLRLPSYGQ